MPPCDQPRPAPNCQDGWCIIEPGCFVMGSGWCEWGRARYLTDPAQVTLTHRFRLQQAELTQDEWRALGLPNPSRVLPDGSGDCSEGGCPVGNVTWFEALAFTNLRSARDGLPACYRLEGCSGELGSGMTCQDARSAGASVYECRGYRLPTGAEWEYAARAGTRTSVFTGDVVERAPMFVCHDDPVLSPIAWYCANAGARTHVGRGKKANAWGLHDMLGNAEEWVGSLVGPYAAGPHIDHGATLEVLNQHRDFPALVQTRGGAWNRWPHALRSGAAPGNPPEARGPGLGFRMAQTLFR